MMKYYILEANG